MATRQPRKLGLDSDFLSKRSGTLFGTESEVVSELRTLKTTVTKVDEPNPLAVRALTDIRAFAELINFQGGWKNFSQCHDELVEFLCKPQNNKDAQDSFFVEGDESAANIRRLILMPRGHLKSTVCNVLYCLWRIYRNPNIRILVACNLQSLAKSFIRELRGYFENTDLDKIWNKRPHIDGQLLPQLQKKNKDRNFGGDTEAEDRKVIWNNDALQVIRANNVYFKEPTVYATSVGTTVTGQHYDLVILDDLIEFKNVSSSLKKIQVEEWIADVESVINPPQLIPLAGVTDVKDIIGGEIVVIGTRYALDDYYSQVIEKQEELGYSTHIRNVYKNGKDDSDGYLWPEKFNSRVVENIKARLSARRFSSQYLNTVYDKDNHLFSPEAIVVLPNDCVFTTAEGTCARHPNGRIELVAPIIAIDPAFTTSRKGDDCAIVIGFKFNDGTTVVVDAVVDRMTASEVVKVVQNLGKLYGTLRVYFEQNGVGALLPELFKTEASRVDGKQFVCVGHYEQREKESKIQGVLELPMLSGKVALCSRVKDNQLIWRQISDYPGVRHDDFLDALVTLHEKSVPSRQIYQGSKTTINWAYNYQSLPTPPDNQQSFLAEYNSEYFR